MELEWDEIKNGANIKKHGISFEDAESAFFDENAVEIFDELNSNAEIRFQIIALSSVRLLFVAFTIRGEEKIRIISARKADAKQANIYNEYKR